MKDKRLVERRQEDEGEECREKLRERRESKEGADKSWEQIHGRTLDSGSLQGNLMKN